MAWSAMPSFADGNLLTAAQLTILTGNLNETAVAKATTAGRHFAAAGVNSVAERVSTVTVTSATETTTSTTYTNLATVGPTATATISASLWVSITCGMFHSTGGGAVIAYALGTANTLAEDDNRAISVRESASVGVSGVFLHTGLSAGSTSVQAKYRIGSAGTGTYQDRRMQILPF